MDRQNNSTFTMEIQKYMYSVKSELKFLLNRLKLAYNIAQCGQTIPPSSFPKSSIAFSKDKQDVWIRLVWHMDVP